MNYQDLIDRLLNNQIQVNPEATHKALHEAADVIESLTAQLADGPVAWMYESEDWQPVEYRAIRRETLPRGWKETPLYHIPITEVKE